jgi:hypothetical protein
LEARIHRLETRVVELEAGLATASETGDVPALAYLGREYDAVRTELNVAYESWGQVA